MLTLNGAIRGFRSLGRFAYIFDEKTPPASFQGILKYLPIVLPRKLGRRNGFVIIQARLDVRGETSEGFLE